MLKRDPSGNIQVRLVDGTRMVVKLNTDHKVSHIKQEIMARYKIKHSILYHII